MDLVGVVGRRKATVWGINVLPPSSTKNLMSMMHQNANAAAEVLLLFSRILKMHLFIRILTMLGVVASIVKMLNLSRRLHLLLLPCALGQQPLPRRLVKLPRRGNNAVWRNAGTRPKREEHASATVASTRAVSRGVPTTP
jgi:hypothetical protein